MAMQVHGHALLLSCAEYCAYMDGSTTRFKYTMCHRYLAFWVHLYSTRMGHICEMVTLWSLEAVDVNVKHAVLVFQG